MNATNHIPAPKAVELHLTRNSEFSRKGYIKKVKALCGRASECRGDSSRRFVTLPWTDEGRALANKLIAEFGFTGPKGVTLIVRGVNTFRGKHVHAHVIVHYVSRSVDDPCGVLLSKYEAAFLRAFPDATEPEPVVEPVKRPPVLRLEIDTSNAAFEDNTIEIAAILRRLADAFENGSPDGGKLRDTNGNTCGSYTFG